jgi:hypothetical protein
MLSARVLLSGSSVMIPWSIPARIASTTSSPIEHTKKETFASRLRVSMSRRSCDFWLRRGEHDPTLG